MSQILTKFFVLLDSYYQLILTPDWWKDNKREWLVDEMDKLYPKLNKTELKTIDEYCWDWYLKKIGEK